MIIQNGFIHRLERLYKQSRSRNNRVQRSGFTITLYCLLTVTISLSTGCMLLPTEGENLVLDVYEIKMNVKDLMAMNKESHQIDSKWQESFAQQEEIRFNQLRDRIQDVDARLQRIEERLQAVEAKATVKLPSAPPTAVISGPADDGASSGPRDAIITNTGLTVSAEEIYNNALGLVEREQYGDAITFYDEILSSFPGSEYAEKAQYGLGEIYEFQKDYQRAIDAYLVVPEKYPDGEKAAQARYKAAMCYIQLGDRGRARELLEEILVKNPSIQGHPRVREALDQLLYP